MLATSLAEIGARDLSFLSLWDRRESVRCTQQKVAQHQTDCRAYYSFFCQLISYA